MIHKIQTPRPTFKSILQYAGDKKNENGQPAAEIIGGNQPAFTTGELIKKFEQYEKLNPRARKPVFHASLSLPPNEHLTDEQWQESVEFYLKKIGFDVEMNPFTIIKHNDTDHEHVHIVASKIRLDGKITRIPKNDFYRGMDACRELEKKFKKATPEKKSNTKKTEPNEYEKKRAERKGLAQTEKEIIQNAIDKIINANEFNLQTENGRNFFETELGKNGVGVTFHIQKDGTKLTGMAFTFENQAYSGTKLGTDYKTNNLCRRAQHVDDKVKAVWQDYHQHNKETWEKYAKEIEKSQKEIAQTLKIKRKRIKELQATNEMMWIFHNAATHARSMAQKIFASILEIYFALDAIQKMSEAQNQKEKIRTEREIQKSIRSERRERIQESKETAKEETQKIKESAGFFSKQKTTANEKTAPVETQTAEQKTTTDPAPEPLFKPVTLDLNVLNAQLAQEIAAKEKAQMRQQQPTAQEKKYRGR